LRRFLALLTFALPLAAFGQGQQQYPPAGATSGGNGTITSVFGRTGPAVTASSGDYTAAQITNAVDSSVSRAGYVVLANCTSASAAPTWCVLNASMIPQLAYSSLSGLPTIPTAVSQLTRAATDYTSPQLVSGLNASPSSTLSTSLIPILNQNTSGTAGGLSVLLARSSGGTGESTVSGIRQANGSSADSAATSAQIVSGLNVSPTTTLAVALIPALSAYDLAGAAGTAQTNAEAAFTGDVTKPANSFTTTLASSGVTPGSCGSATAVCVPTFDIKGRVTSFTTATISTAYDATGAATAAQTNAEAAFTGDVTKGANSFATAVTALNGTALSGLATGILKNTTGTGVPSIAVANTDYATPNQNTTGTAANLSGTPTLPNGTAAATQAQTDTSNSLATDAFVNAAAHGTFLSVTGTGAAASATSYYSIGGATVGTTAPSHQIPMSQVVKVKSLYCYTNSTQSSTGSLAVSLGQCTPTGTPLACTPSTTGQPSVTFAAGATGTVLSDATHTPTYAVGDFMTIVAVNAATATSATLVACTITY
jgi:hypothetical protein